MSQKELHYYTMFYMHTNHNIPTWLLGRPLFHTWRVQFQRPRPLRWHNHHMTEEQNRVNYVDEKTLHKKVCEEDKTHPAPYCYPVFVNKSHVNEFPIIDRKQLEHIWVATRPDILYRHSFIMMSHCTISVEWKWHHKGEWVFRDTLPHSCYLIFHFECPKASVDGVQNFITLVSASPSIKAGDNNLMWTGEVRAPVQLETIVHLLTTGASIPVQISDSRNYQR